MRGLAAVVFLVAIQLSGCGGEGNTATDAGASDLGADAGPVDAGPPSPTCSSLTVSCAGLAAAECVGRVGCQTVSRCDGTPAPCNFYGRIECPRHPGCEFNPRTEVCEALSSRRCGNLRAADCADEGCTYDPNHCERVDARCESRTLQSCEADALCRATCPSGYTLCAAGCVRDAQAVDNVDCVVDCAGVLGGGATVDDCGVCDADPTNDCTSDCAGVPGGSSTLDDCGVCDDDPSNDCVLDCTDDNGDPAMRDECGVCDNDSQNDCVQDCNGEWGGVGQPGTLGCSSSAPASCPGEWYLGNCWFLGAVGESCNQTCSAAGLSYDDDTRRVAGSQGDLVFCSGVLGALGVFGSSLALAGNGATEALGCARRETPSVAPRQYTGAMTTAAAADATHSRACACE